MALVPVDVHRSQKSYKEFKYQNLTCDTRKEAVNQLSLAQSPIVYTLRFRHSPFWMVVTAADRNWYTGFEPVLVLIIAVQIFLHLKLQVISDADCNVFRFC